MKKTVSIALAGCLVGIAALGYGAGKLQSTIAPVTAASAAPLPNQKEIENVVRNYLLQNPEILLEMQSALETKQTAAVQEQFKKALAANKDTLYDAKHDSVFGNPKGDLTVYEFFDYNCGYCKRALPDMHAILKNDPNIRFVMKEFPILGPDSVRAHVVAQAFKTMMPEKYAEYHDQLLGEQERATEETAIAVAVKLGADETALRAKMKDPAIVGAAQSTYKLANELNISGTPSYIIGNELVPGAIGVEGLVERIAAARTAAKN